MRAPALLIARAIAAPPRRRLAIGTALLFALRLALSIVRTGPVVVADEVGYLTNARVLAGGVAGQMSTAPFYHGGYSLLLAPVVALIEDPGTDYRVALVVNALIAASLAPLLYLMLTRCFRVASGHAVWPALAAAAYPSVTIFTQVTLSENLLLPLIVLWLLCFGAFLDATAAQRGAWACAAAACAVWLWAAHGRMIVAPVATGCALVAVAIARRATARAAVLGLVVLAVGAVAVHELNVFLMARSWNGRAPSEIQGRLSTIESLSGIGSFLRNLVGMSWYVTVASLGTLAAAAGSLVPDLRRPQTQDVVLALTLVTGLGLLVESALSFRTLDRPDMLIYGRYVEVVLPPLLALALVRLAAGRARPAAAVVALVVGSVAAVALRATAHPTGAANRWNVASLPAPTFDLQPFVLAVAGGVALFAIAALFRARRWKPAAVAPLALLLFLPTTAIAEREPVLSAQRSFYPSGWTSPASAVGGAHNVAFDTDYSGGLWVYQWFLPRTRVLLFSRTSAALPSRLVIAAPQWAAAHRRLRPTLLWRDDGRRRALFSVRRPG